MRPGKGNSATPLFCLLPPKARTFCILTARLLHTSQRLRRPARARGQERIDLVPDVRFERLLNLPRFACRPPPPAKVKDSSVLSRPASAEPRSRITPGSRGVELMEEAAVRRTPSPSAAYTPPARSGELQPRALNLTPSQQNSLPSPRRVRRPPRQFSVMHGASPSARGSAATIPHLPPPPVLTRRLVSPPDTARRHPARD